MVLTRKGQTMNRKTLSMIGGAMISMASMITPPLDARPIGLALTLAPLALEAKPVAAEKCAKLMARSKMLGTGCFAAGYGVRGMVEVLKALGLHQLAIEIEEMLRGAPAGALRHEGERAGGK
jgi:hypothetical protein